MCSLRVICYNVRKGQSQMSIGGTGEFAQPAASMPNRRISPAGYRTYTAGRYKYREERHEYNIIAGR